MKNVLALLAGFGRNKLFLAHVASHDDRLRANQGAGAPGFSFWRALVS
jgi:hypothetical protein